MIKFKCQHIFLYELFTITLPNHVFSFFFPFYSFLKIVKLDVSIHSNPCLFENRSPFVFPLNREKSIIFSRSYTKYSPPERDLFWRAVRRENFARSQYSKWVTKTWRKMAQFCCIWTHQVLILPFTFGRSFTSIRDSKTTSCLLY